MSHNDPQFISEMTVSRADYSRHVSPPRTFVENARSPPADITDAGALPVDTHKQKPQTVLTDHLGPFCALRLRTLRLMPSNNFSIHPILATVNRLTGCSQIG